MSGCQSTVSQPFVGWEPLCGSAFAVAQWCGVAALGAVSYVPRTAPPKPGRR